MQRVRAARAARAAVAAAASAQPPAGTCGGDGADRGIGPSDVRAEAPATPGESPPSRAWRSAARTPGGPAQRAARFRGRCHAAGRGARSGRAERLRTLARGRRPRRRPGRGAAPPRDRARRAGAERAAASRVLASLAPERGAVAAGASGSRPPSRSASGPSRRVSVCSAPRVQPAAAATMSVRVRRRGRGLGEARAGGPASRAPSRGRSVASRRDPRSPSRRDGPAGPSRPWAARSWARSRRSRSRAARLPLRALARPPRPPCPPLARRGGGVPAARRVPVRGGRAARGAPRAARAPRRARDRSARPWAASSRASSRSSSRGRSPIGFVSSLAGGLVAAGGLPRCSSGAPARRGAGRPPVRDPRLRSRRRHRRAPRSSSSAGSPRRERPRRPRRATTSPRSRSALWRAEQLEVRDLRSQIRAQPRVSFASICRARSRVSLKRSPMSWSVSGVGPSGG